MFSVCSRNKGGEFETILLTFYGESTRTLKSQCFFYDRFLIKSDLYTRFDFEPHVCAHKSHACTIFETPQDGEQSKPQSTSD